MSSSPHIHTNPAPDLIVIGGGVVGLWSALAAARKGLGVRLVEKQTIGAGASGGMLGALMPHQPSGWSAKKRFQLKGLLSLPDSLAELEDATSIVTGYQRVGRIMPIGHAEKRKQSQSWVDGAKDNWPDGIDWTIKDTHPAIGWAGDIASHGWNTDTLSARINPRLLMQALEARARQMPTIEICEGCIFDPQDDTGQPTIMAAGLGTFALVDPDNPHRIGKGVKGQGARLQPAKPVDPTMPIIYDNGTYVIAHADGSVAVGSTSENSFDHPTQTDHLLDDVVADAQRITPALEGAQIIERWAGVRPKAGKPDPLLGPLPDKPNTIIATGGFKITFAIAHTMADIALAMATGEHADVPGEFLPKNRLL